MLTHNRNQGQYQGCFAQSHWSGKRVKHQWDLFCRIAPKQAKQFSELPNHVRTLLGVSELKHTNSKFKQSDGSHRIPVPIMLALDNLLCERISLGEEVTHDFAAATLLRLITVWNEQLKVLTSQTREMGQRMLADHDEQDDDEEAQQASGNHIADMLSQLQECKISTNPGALMILGCHTILTFMLVIKLTNYYILYDLLTVAEDYSTFL